MELEALLTGLGLSSKEAATYLAILQTGRSTIKPISDRAGIKRTSIYNFINRLVELGLISKIQIRGRYHYEATSPERLLELQQDHLRRVEQALPALSELFLASGSKPRISFFEGAGEMKNIVIEETRCNKEALYIWPGSDIMKMIGGAEYMTEVDRKRIAQGVQIKTVRFREKDITFATSADGPKFLRQLRFAPPSLKFTMGMGVYDTGKVGFFSSEREGFGILIESQELMQMMKTMFSLVWDRCLPARQGEG